MRSLIKKILRFFLKRPFVYLKNLCNKAGSKKKCYICQNTFNHFTKLRGGKKKQPKFRLLLNGVGSDVDNFGCIYCGSNDRERHLFMFFDKLELWGKMKNAKILHFAPENNIAERIVQQRPIEYIKGDLYPMAEDVEKIDVTKIQYANDTFDFVICNHVLEHVPDYLQALKEIYRVLKPNGSAILQTPYSKLLSRNFEEENINTNALRNFFYAQDSHVRLFSEKHLLSDIEKTGFVLHIMKNDKFFDNNISAYHGINKKEDLIWVIKP